MEKWNDELEIIGDAREEIEREEANRERPEAPAWTDEELERFAAMAELEHRDDDMYFSGPFGLGFRLIS